MGNDLNHKAGRRCPQWVLHRQTLAIILALADRIANGENGRYYECPDRRQAKPASSDDHPSMAMFDAHYSRLAQLMASSEDE